MVLAAFDMLNAKPELGFQVHLTGLQIFVWLTLAGTSVGRGFDSVGHKAGTYRNRVRIEAAATK